jgi:hypothetical protein
MFGLVKKKSISASDVLTSSAVQVADVSDGPVAPSDITLADEVSREQSTAASGDVPWLAFPDKQQEIVFQKRKMQLHESLVEALNLKFAAGVDGNAARRMFRNAVTSVVDRDAAIESAFYKSRLVQELIDEAEGLGPLECLMQDQAITDVLVNNPHEVFVETLEAWQLGDH